MSDDMMTDNPEMEPVEPKPVPETDNTAEAPETGPAETGSDDDQDDLLAQLEEADDTDNEGPSDTVEVEYEGKTYKVPPALKDAVLRQADYTRKTQEVAELRKQAEETQRIAAAHAEEMGRVKVLEAEYQSKFGKMTRDDWLKLQTEDPIEFQRKRFEHDSLVQDHSQAQHRLQQAIQATDERQRQETAKAIERGEAELRERIKGWGPEKAKEVAAFAVNEFGLDPEHVSRVTNPKHVEILHDAMQFRKLVQKRKAASKAPEEAQPAGKVKTRSGPPKGLDDRLSTDEWMKRRAKQAG